MAHKKAQGSTSYGRDSQGQRLGVKLFAGQYAQAGAIIVRQRGTVIWPGENVRRAADDTLFATRSGKVKYRLMRKVRFDGTLKRIKLVDVTPAKAVS